MVGTMNAISLRGTITSIVLAVADRQRLRSRVAELVSGALLLFAMACCGLGPVDAVASNVKFVGNAAYTYTGNVAVLTATRSGTSTRQALPVLCNWNSGRSLRPLVAGR